MHRLSLIFFIAFGLVVLLFSLFSQTRPSFGVDFIASPSAIEHQTIVSENSYYLAYPGILPDNPFYWLKMIRDRVKLWTTKDPLAKTQLLILYADKRIGAAEALAAGNKPQQSESTATKAELYLKQASDVLQTQDTASQEVKDLWQTINLSSQKHLEILNYLKASLPEDRKSSIEKSIVTTNQLQLDSIQKLDTTSN